MSSYTLQVICSSFGGGLLIMLQVYKLHYDVGAGKELYML